MKVALLIFIALTVGLSVRFVLLGQKSQDMKVSLGLKEGRLQSCDVSSHCYHSDDQEVPLLGKEKLSPDLLERIKSQAKKMGLILQKEEGQYLHFTHQSKVFGFVDDIEFYYLHESQELQFRSSSRVGKSDLGVNKKRVVELLNALK